MNPTQHAQNSQLPLPDLPPGPAIERLRGPVEIPPYEPWQLALAAIFAAIVLGLLAWWAFRLWRQHARRPRPVSPREAALAELDAAQRLTADDDERFTLLTSGALRRYFEDAWMIPALDRTTEEFLSALAPHAILEAEAQSSLRSCLALCDQVKFARRQLRAEERTQLTTQARHLITLMEAKKQEEVKKEASHP